MNTSESCNKICNSFPLPRTPSQLSWIPTKPSWQVWSYESLIKMLLIGCLVKNKFSVYIIYLIMVKNNWTKSDFKGLSYFHFIGSGLFYTSPRGHFCCMLYHLGMCLPGNGLLLFKVQRLPPLNGKECFLSFLNQEVSPPSPLHISHVFGQMFVYLTGMWVPPRLYSYLIYLIYSAI